MFEIKIVEKIKTHILYTVIFPPPENHSVYEIMLKKYGGTRAAAHNVVHARCFLDK
jgi:hypothetical protein